MSIQYQCDESLKIIKGFEEMNNDNEGLNWQAATYFIDFMRCEIERIKRMDNLKTRIRKNFVSVEIIKALKIGLEYTINTGSHQAKDVNFIKYIISKLE